MRSSLNHKAELSECRAALMLAAIILWLLADNIEAPQSNH